MKLTVTKYGAPWCSPCRGMQPDWEKVVTEYAGRVNFREVNVDDAGVGYREAVAHDIQSVPVILFETEKDASQHFGAMKYRQIKAKIDSLLT